MYVTHGRLTTDSMLIAPSKMVPPTASAKPASICAENPVIGPDGGSEQTAWRSSQTRRCLDMARKPPNSRRLCKPNPPFISHKSATESLQWHAEILKFL
jgi:hypothetical protein